MTGGNGPGQILVARFHVRKAALPVRVVQALYKDWTPVYVTADGTAYRVPEALADGPLMVSLPPGGGRHTKCCPSHRLTLSKPPTEYS